MSDPCDAHTATCAAAVEREHAREEAEKQYREEQYEEAVDAYIQDVGRFHMHIVDFLTAWLLFAEDVRRTGTGKEPVFPQPPIHPDEVGE